MASVPLLNHSVYPLLQVSAFHSINTIEELKHIEQHLLRLSDQIFETEEMHRHYVVLSNMQPVLTVVNPELSHISHIGVPYIRMLFINMVLGSLSMRLCESKLHEAGYHIHGIPKAYESLVN